MDSSLYIRVALIGTTQLRTHTRGITYVIYNSEKDNRLLQKGQVLAVRCAHLLFRFPDKKTRIGEAYVARNKAFI